jgi:hypothetical protein
MHGYLQLLCSLMMQHHYSRTSVLSAHPIGPACFANLLSHKIFLTGHPAVQILLCSRNSFPSPSYFIMSTRRTSAGKTGAKVSSVTPACAPVLHTWNRRSSELQAVHTCCFDTSPRRAASQAARRVNLQFRIADARESAMELPAVDAHAACIAQSYRHYFIQ